MTLPRTPPPSSSPQWSTNTKLVVGLTVVAVMVALLVYVRAIIGPLLLAFILAYVLHPVAGRLIYNTRLSWRMAANLIYLVVVILVGGLLAWSGIAIVQQFQSLIRVVQRFIEVDLPLLAAELSTNVYEIGPFQLDLTRFDLLALSDQVLGILQPVLVQSGALLSSFATSAASTLGWILFILVVSYFILAEAGRVPYNLRRIDIPGYDEDIRRLVAELQRIWSAFLRGQLIIFILAVILTLILLSLVGLRLALVIAIIAGVGKFIPYLGPLIVLVVAGVASFFQAGNIFGLLPWQYTILVLVALVVLDQTFDNLVTPRILGRTLDLHPAAILIAALIAFNLIGVVGLVLAAPVLATVKLVGRYMLRKMLDLDPWVELGEPAPPFEFPWKRIRDYSRERWMELRGRKMEEEESEPR
jgi:predicted PurR-regulated permease PerM